MSIESRRHQYGTVFGHWQIGELLGASKNGQTAVFHLRHKESSQEESAVKVITLIEEHGKLSEFSPRRKAEYEAELEKRKQHALNEVQIMYALKGYTNIVSYEDRVTEPWTEDNSFGCDLLIRMELLRDLRKIIDTGHIFSEAEIIKIGKDICTALILCHEEKDPIIHRDIKPENIFVNARGDYKLGDFGISRILDRCHGTTATTAIGTPEYYAPEQERKGYDERVDIYSLGLVLYELSNQNRRPFMESTYDNGGKANLLRLSGTKFPPPCDASDDFAKVILKACAFKANARYRTAKEMLAALEKLSITPHSRTFKPAKTSTKSASHSYETVPSNTIPGSGNSFATVPATPTTPGNASDEWLDQLLASTDTENNLDTKINAEEAAAQLKKAEDYAENGNSKLAHKYFKLAAENGNPRAMYCMGHCYFYGQEEKRNYSKAVEYFVKAANLDDVNAQYMLGVCYSRGKGVKKNYEKAAFWYQKACDNSVTHAGSALAHTALGDLYYYGRGVKKDLLKAMDHYLQAIKEDDVKGAIRYERILSKVSSSDEQQFLERNGHERANIPVDFAKRKKKYYDDKVDSAFAAVTFALPVVALIVGIFMWFLSVPLWINILVVAIFGLLAVTTMIISDRASHSFDDWRTKLLLYCIGAIGFPVITAIVIAVIECVLWLGKWIISFFA